MLCYDFDGYQFYSINLACRLLELSCRLTSERIRRTALQSVRIRRVGSALRPLLGYLGYGPKARHSSANNFKR
jgi:hypothetical protein